MSQRKIVDCRLYPSDKCCTLSIEGTEEEVLQAAHSPRGDHAWTHKQPGAPRTN
jgi:hypothetical protein